MTVQSVWRVQDRFGMGPYCRYGICDWQTKKHNTENGCPGPVDDLSSDDYEKFFGDDGIPRKYKMFGFSNLDDLKAWFEKEEIENLKEAGYFPVKIRGKILYYGENQVVFIKEKFLDEIENLI